MTVHHMGLDYDIIVHASCNVLHCIYIVTNHMGFISRHIMPLVIIINNLGCGHAHACTHTDDPHRINFKKPVSLQPVASAPGLKILQSMVAIAI